MRSPGMRGLPNISRIGRRARGFWPQVGESDAADKAYEIAIGLESDPAVRRFLQERRAALSVDHSSIV